MNDMHAEYDESRVTIAGNVLKRQQAPILRVFGPGSGGTEYAIEQATTTIGRLTANDITLPEQTVSREHAQIVNDGGTFILEDRGSRSGTCVNGEKIERAILQDGDSIEICSYVIQFVTNEAPAGSAEALQHAKSLLGVDVTLPPPNMRLKYRFLANASTSTFGKGDTLNIGRGNLLLPCPLPTNDCTCLELHIAWPNGTNKRYLCENLGEFAAGGSQWICIKLHATTKAEYEGILQSATPGNWIDADH